MQRLASLIATGATPARASVVLKRTVAACQVQARKMGMPFQDIRIKRRLLKKVSKAEKTLSGPLRQAPMLSGLIDRK